MNRQLPTCNIFNAQRIMLFGLPGSGKSTFANQLSKHADIPVYHLDKYFFSENWVELDHSKFMKDQEKMVNQDSWIIDGNALSSLETRWEKADLVLYFQYPKLRCLYRLLKRRLQKERKINDRASGCKEILRWRLIKYMWSFHQRAHPILQRLKSSYPDREFQLITSDSQIAQLLTRHS